MPFEAGNNANPNGRPKGSKNKTKYEVSEILKAHNCDPFEVLAKIATDNIEDSEGNKKKVAIYIRMEAAAELAQYIAPKLKSIEHSGDPESPVLFNIHLGTNAGTNISGNQNSK